MSALDSLEANLNDMFGKSAPPLPPNAKKIIAEYLPYINLVLGVLTLLVALGLYHAAHTVNRLVDYANNLSAAYGGTVRVNHLSATVWIALVVLIIEAVLYIAAYPGTKARKKSGWDLLFYALLINIVYGIIAVFTDYGGVGRLIGSVIGSVIGLYFLFQIRSVYVGRSAGRKTPVAK